MIVLCALLLLVTGVTSIQVEYFDFGATIVQTQKPTGEYLFDYGQSELFHVDLDSKQVAWTMPDLEKHTGFDAQGGLQNINIMKHNLNIYIKRSNNTAATSIQPEGKLYAENSIVLGEPNVLICAVKRIFPPVMNMTWLKNGEKIYDGVTESLFRPSQDHSFRKFLYLAFIPTVNDIYTCEVEHWGLSEPLQMMWSPPSPHQRSEAPETLICALGLSVGLIGLIAGITFLIKGMRLNAQHRWRRN
ncbi:H-2 class II histocompatibility antigen, A-U alpha chain-like [Gastrophryne carolinensis]